MVTIRSWVWLALACLVLIGVVDATLLQLGLTFFSGGYNGEYIRGPTEVGAFLFASSLLDLWLILGIWTLVLPVAVRLRVGRLRTVAALLLLTLAVPWTIDYVRFHLHHILGSVAGLGLLWALSGQDTASTVAEATANFPVLFMPAILVGVALALVTTLAPRGGSLPTMPLRRMGGALALLTAFGLTMLGSGWVSSPIQYGLHWKPSGIVLTRIGGWITDVDRDGFGPFSSLRDPAPFDGSIHPFALDLPGNGLDENGLAGDHPIGFEPLPGVRVDNSTTPRQPHVLLILLESYRADLIEREYRGQPVNPFLSRLAREGASSRHAYVHSPGTAASRAQLFSGHVPRTPGSRTIIDDFQDRGYFVAWFSGQNDAYGNSVDLMGGERADLYYDARQDVSRRASRSSSPVGLQVSWKLLNQYVLEFLASYDSDQPLFLFVNVVDTHFPYHHDELDLILDVEPIARDAIRVERAEDVWATYLNTAANVDRAVEELVHAWWERLGRDGLLLVTADHGQSLYDDQRFLGHGRSLRREQTQVPFILWGGGGDWPEPLGLADVRHLLQRDLPGGRARFVPEPDRQLLQYMARIDEPRLLGLRSLDQTVIYDLANDQLEFLGPEDRRIELAPEEQDALFESLIRNWEALRLRRSGITSGEPARGPTGSETADVSSSGREPKRRALDQERHTEP
jgi:hypothetical protein